MTPAPEQPSQTPRIAAVVITNGHADQLRRCLDALGSGLAVVVVDNGWNDSAGLDADYPAVRFVRLPRNFGLTKALNIGIRAVAAEMVMILSPDVEITGPAVEMLADALDAEPNVGAVSPLLVTPSGTLAAQVSALPSVAKPDPVFRAAAPGEQAACITGKAIMFRAFFLRALRHVDERYGDYGSSMELSRQVIRANKTILVHPTATAILDERADSVSAAQQTDREVGTYHYLAKHAGFAAGLGYLVKRAGAALVRFQLGRVMGLLSLKKIDGN